MGLSEADFLGMLQRQEALLEGHFVLSSGLHSSRYIQCARLLQSPPLAERACVELASRWRGERPDVVIGPAIGGIVIAYELARAFDVPGIFAEREGTKFALRRGFALEPGARVLVAEDVVTTGGSAAEVLALAREHGGRPVGVLSLIARTPKNPFDVPYASLATIVPPAWPPQHCPLCLAGTVAVKPGSRPSPATS
jgi:orotate phosphoribosyltransferase